VADNAAISASRGERPETMHAERSNLAFRLAALSLTMPLRITRPAASSCVSVKNLIEGL
jgi:hypothetical protein